MRSAQRDRAVVRLLVVLGAAWTVAGSFLIGRLGGVVQVKFSDRRPSTPRQREQPKDDLPYAIKKRRYLKTSSLPRLAINFKC